MTTRVFTVEVTGCKDCPMRGMENKCNHLYARRMLPRQQDEIFAENRDAITESCPMYQHSFVKDEKK